MRRRHHWYEVHYLVEERDDCKGDWTKVEDTIVLETDNYEKAMQYIYIHRFNEFDGDLDYRSYYVEKVR